MHVFQKLTFVSITAISTLLLSFTLSWSLLAKQEFLYDVWHDYTSLGEGVSKFGPKNRFKPGFGETTPEQRLQLFAEINRAVHNRGEGLNKISYQTPTSGGAQLMLREPEVVHLVDVANLISLLKTIAFVNVIIWFGLLVATIKVPFRVITWASQLGGVLLFKVVGLVAILLLGPTKVFNQLHIWIFPDGHQWFFYYQESLMSTLMMAPNLFGWIAIALTGVALAVFSCLISVLKIAEGKVKYSKA